MRTCRTRLRSCLYIAGCCGFLWVLSGCSVIGPQSIANGCAAYNEVINQTEDQQMLMAIVRNRYGETISMLAVDNVTPCRIQSGCLLSIFFSLTFKLPGSNLYTDYTLIVH